jgi:hypothetical protein
MKGANVGVSAQSNMGLPLATMLAAACEGGQPEMFDTVVLQARDGAPLTLSAEQLQRMTWTELSAIWKVPPPAFPPSIDPHMSRDGEDFTHLHESSAALCC